MKRRWTDWLIIILLFPVYAVYGIVFVLAFPIEKLLELVRIDLGIRLEIKNIFRDDNIRRQYVYIMFRMVNVGIFFYLIFQTTHTSIFKFKELKSLFSTSLICLAAVIILHFLKKLFYRKLGITPYKEISAKEMDGIRFEQYCAEMLRTNGYKNVRLTKASGDQGVDILAEYKKEKYAVQCKYYSTPLGNKPVQEVYAGKTFYECDKAMVMTNNKFTKGAIELAESVNVKLWPSIPIMDSGRGLVYFWYIIDIIVMTILYFTMKKNLDNYVGIILFGVGLVYLALLIYICVGFMTVRDLEYYKKNVEYLGDDGLADYKYAIELLAAKTDEYENIAHTTVDIYEFNRAIGEIEAIYSEVEIHEQIIELPDDVEDEMDAYFQNKHVVEMGFLDRAYQRDSYGRLLIPQSDYDMMKDFSEEAKEYISNDIKLEMAENKEEEDD